MIGAWSRDAERLSLFGNTDCYHGNRHRYHGYVGLNGSHFERNTALPASGGGRAYSTVTLMVGARAYSAVKPQAKF